MTWGSSLLLPLLLCLSFLAVSCLGKNHDISEDGGSFSSGGGDGVAAADEGEVSFLEVSSAHHHRRHRRDETVVRQGKGLLVKPVWFWNHTAEMDMTLLDSGRFNFKRSEDASWQFFYLKDAVVEWDKKDQHLIKIIVRESQYSKPVYFFRGKDDFDTALWKVAFDDVWSKTTPCPTAAQFIKALEDRGLAAPRKQGGRPTTLPTSTTNHLAALACGSPRSGFWFEMALCKFYYKFAIWQRDFDAAWFSSLASRTEDALAKTASVLLETASDPADPFYSLVVSQRRAGHLALKGGSYEELKKTILDLKAAYDKAVTDSWHKRGTSTAPGLGRRLAAFCKVEFSSSSSSPSQAAAAITTITPTALPEVELSDLDTRTSFSDSTAGSSFEFD